MSKITATAERLEKIIDNGEELINKKLADVAYRFDNYHKVPPIIGMIIADQYGNTIMVAEYDCKNSKYGPIKSYLAEDDKNLLEIDLISMYFSSLKTFAGQTNIKNLSHLQIYGSNIKVQIYFMYNKYMLILFLNSNTELKPKIKSNLIDYFKLNLEEFEYEFDNFNLSESRKIIMSLEKEVKTKLKKLNQEYLQGYQQLYTRKHEIIDKTILEITPISLTPS